MIDTDKFVYEPGSDATLADFQTKFAGHFADDEEARAVLAEDAESLAKYQSILMAHGTYGLIVLFQGMDGAGKDATIKHVMSSVDPQGCEVKMFKNPTGKEVKHDYLWRAALAFPARGQIGIFNRSYYEHVLGERVHPEKLEAQQLPDEARGENLWAKRYEHINNMERYLFENGIHVLKFYLNLSYDEQRERLLERMARPDKKWKFSESDIKERAHWGDYMKAYEQTFKHTSTEYAPWHLIPADNRWFARAAVASVIVAKLKSFHTDYPQPDKEQEQELESARRTLEAERATATTASS